MLVRSLNFIRKPRRFIRRFDPFLFHWRMCVSNIKYKFNPGVQNFIWIITVGVEYAPGYSV